jgi:hypothetical protein
MLVFHPLIAPAYPCKGTLECFSLPPIEKTPEWISMSAEQMTAAGVSAHERIYWCSDCALFM